MAEADARDKMKPDPSSRGTASVPRLRWLSGLTAAALAAVSTMAGAQASAPTANKPGETVKTGAPAVPVPLGVSVPAAKQVTVLEFGTPPQAFQTTGEQYSQVLTLNYDPVAAPGALRVEVMPLDCDGVTAETSLVRAETTKPGDPAPTTRVVTIDKPVPPVWVVMATTLPRITTCTGQLRFKLGALPIQPMALRVTRAAPVELPVELSSLQRVSTGLMSDTVTFTMKGLLDRAVTVKPKLFELGLKGETSESKLNAHFEGSSVKPASVALTPEGGLGEFTLTLDNLSPGEYVGKLDLASEGFHSKSQSFSFSSRYGWWVAAVLIAIGAGLALYLKRVATRVRPRLVVRAAASRLLAQVELQLRVHALDPAEAGVLDAVRTRILQVLDEASQPGDPTTGWADSARDRLAAEGTKLTAFGNWMNARRLLASITDMPTADRAAFEQKLTAARQALSGPLKLDDAMVATLSSMPGDIEDEKAKAAQATVAAAAQTAADAASSTTNPDAAGAFKESQAQAKQASDLLAVKNYPGYQAAYDASGRAYYAGLATELEARLPPPPAGPADLLAVQFATIAPAVREHLAQVKVAPDLQTAHARYTDALAALHPVQAAAVLQALPGAQAIALQAPDFPDPAVRNQQPLAPPLLTSVVEDTKELTKRIQRLDDLVDGLAVVSAALLGVLLVWNPNPGWGRPVDLIAAFLWGMGLHTVGSSTFEGILNLRAKLS